MAFIRPRQRPAGPAAKSRVVLAVGQRAFVNALPDALRPVVLTDDHGHPGDGTLRDGTEVEIVGWRPRGAKGTRYRVRDRSGGSDGWLEAEELRTTPSRPTPEPAGPPPTALQGRRFGSTG
jgi:hypothetical protein